MADVLNELGTTHALVVHGLDGLDEFSLSAPTVVHELRNGSVVEYEVTPESVGLARTDAAAQGAGVGAHENAAIARSILTGEQGARRDVVVLNAAAACVVAGLAEDLAEGVQVAARSIDEGAAIVALDSFVAESVARGTSDSKGAA
jgi:anthranilate phosphoribosyltransferase